jgi:hypothetical protein
MYDGTLFPWWSKKHSKRNQLLPSWSVFYSISQHVDGVTKKIDSLLTWGFVCLHVDVPLGDWSAYLMSSMIVQCDKDLLSLLTCGCSCWGLICLPNIIYDSTFFTMYSKDILSAYMWMFLCGLICLPNIIYDTLIFIIIGLFFSKKRKYINTQYRRKI